MFHDVPRRPTTCVNKDGVDWKDSPAIGTTHHARGRPEPGGPQFYGPSCFGHFKGKRIPRRIHTTVIVFSFPISDRAAIILSGSRRSYSFVLSPSRFISAAAGFFFDTPRTRKTLKIDSTNMKKKKRSKKGSRSGK